MIRCPHEVKWPERSSRWARGCGWATGPAETVAASGRKYVMREGSFSKCVRNESELAC